MAHKYTDYDNLGGFPLALDDLIHDRNGVYEAISAMYGDGGSTPMILSGNWSTSAWLVVNKEVIPFVSAGLLPPLLSGWAYYIVVNESKSPATFEDLTIKNVLACTKVASLVAADTAAPPSGGILQDSFIPFSKIFGEKARGTWQTISASATQFDYSFSFKKNILTNTLHLKGTITLKAGFTSTFNYYWVMGSLPVDCRPASAVPISAYYRYHGSSLKDSTNSDFISTINGEVSSGGNISFGLRRPDSSTSTYNLYFNTIIPLD